LCPPEPEMTLRVSTLRIHQLRQPTVSAGSHPRAWPLQVVLQLLRLRPVMGPRPLRWLPRRGNGGGGSCKFFSNA
jgi:hypothetical protein